MIQTKNQRRKLKKKRRKEAKRRDQEEKQNQIKTEDDPEESIEDDDSSLPPEVEIEYVPEKFDITDPTMRQFARIFEAFKVTGTISLSFHRMHRAVVICCNVSVVLLK